MLNEVKDTTNAMHVEWNIVNNSIHNTNQSYA